MDDEFEPLGRIVIAIKTYRLQTGDYSDLLTNNRVNAFLKSQLRTTDYHLWQYIIAGEQASLRTDLRLPDLEAIASLRQFEQLIGRYKRAVYERYQPGNNGTGKKKKDR